MAYNLTTGANNTQTNLSKKFESGYDLPIVGLDNGMFLTIHVPALTCIFCGFIGATTIMRSSIARRNTPFFKWTKCERFAIYIGLCDALFNIFHAMDHTYLLVTRSHIYPKPLCTFYNMMLVEFITAQLLMVYVIAINIFILISYGKDSNFGRKDWRLLLWVFGFPAVTALIALFLGILGPNGSM